MRIFIGLVEVANIGACYAKGFRALGHETFSIVNTRHPFFPDGGYDLVVSDRARIPEPGKVFSKADWLNLRVFMMRQFIQALLCCDVFVFMSGTSFLPRSLDYALIKVFGKRIVSVFVGSDIRHWYAFEQEMRQIGIEKDIRPFIDYFSGNPVSTYPEQLRLVKTAERYADLILSQPGNGQLQSRPYMRMNVPLDLQQLHFQVPDRAIPVILHAPSRRVSKGTEYVLAAVEQLKNEGLQFDFRLIENMPHEEICSQLTEADIVVDELFADTVGVLSSEGMATGNAVLVHYPAEFAGVPVGCPAYHTNRDNVTDHLRQVIQDRELRCQLAYAGRPYVAANNDQARIAAQIMGWLQPGGITHYDFTPTFYRNLVIPPQVLQKEQQRYQAARD